MLTDAKLRARDVASADAVLCGFSYPDDRFLKRLAAHSRGRVCAAGAMIARNGAPVAERARSDARGRALHTWEGCVDLRPGEVLLLGDAPDSFDGRYWGVTPMAQVEGVWRSVATLAGGAGPGGP